MKCGELRIVSFNIPDKHTSNPVVSGCSSVKDFQVVLLSLWILPFCSVRQADGLLGPILLNKGVCGFRGQEGKFCCNSWWPWRATKEAAQLTDWQPVHGSPVVLQFEAFWDDTKGQELGSEAWGSVGRRKSLSRHEREGVRLWTTLQMLMFKWKSCSNEQYSTKVESVTGTECRFNELLVSVAVRGGASTRVASRKRET